MLSLLAGVLLSPVAFTSLEDYISRVRAADPYVWLQDSRDGERALAWVDAENRRTFAALKGDSRYAANEAAARLAHEGGTVAGDGPGSAFIDGWMHQVQTDASHPLGVWRRATRESLGSGHPQWETLVDLDALSKAERSRYSLLPAELKCLQTRCLVKLIVLGAGGNDWCWREFDLEKREFVADGFRLPVLAWSSILWEDANTVLLSAPVSSSDRSGAGMSVTVRRWKRGSPASASEVIYRAPGDASYLNLAEVVADSARAGAIVWTGGSSSASEQLLYRKDGKFRLWPFGLKVFPVGIFHGRWIVTNPLSDWKIDDRVFPAGSYCAIDERGLESASPQVDLLIRPREREMLSALPSMVTRDGLILVSYDNARSRLLRITEAQGRWSVTALPGPTNGNWDVLYAGDPTSSDTYAVYQDYLRPPALYEIDMQAGSTREIMQLRPQFDASRHLIEQLEVASADGVKVPYFLVRPKNMPRDGSTPTLLNGYGAGWEMPRYKATLGMLWLEKGGAFVLAVVRGGSELGPKWAVRGVERRHTYEDFVAVAEDLIRRRITSPQKLGLLGHSRGGTLVTVPYNQRPELFNAVVVQNGVLDPIGQYDEEGGIRRYDVQTDYGSLQNPAERAFLEQISPYGNLKQRSHAPEVFIMSARNDGRLTGTSRKFAAKMRALGLPYLFYEHPTMGHDLGDTADEFAEHEALTYTFLQQRLMGGKR